MHDTLRFQPVMAPHVAAQFVHALAAGRWTHVRDLMGSRVEFRGMTPSRCWEATTADEVVTGVLRVWFDDSDEIVALVRCDVESVADRHRLGYRLRVRNPDGVYLVDQQGYCDVDGRGRIVRLHLMCAGFRPDLAAPEDSRIDK